MTPPGGVGCREAIWLLGSLRSLHRLPFDAGLVAQQFPPPYTVATLREAVQALGFRTGTTPVAQADWARLPLPAVGFLPIPPAEGRAAQSQAAEHPAGVANLTGAAAADDDDQSAAVGGVAALVPVLIVKADATELRYFRCGETVPQTLATADVAKVLGAELILVARADHEAGDDLASDAATADTPVQKRPFGFRWFVPELLRHRSIWRDVLLASLAIQLVGLATPLFTQVIIDKVIVHQTHGTLIVLAVALAVFMLFTSGMTWLRQYLVLHTGNRIDAVLGAQVFRHLLRLPLPYFENRATGTLVARLQGVETIREFVSGAAVTLLLDLPFLLIFLAVMFFYSWQLSLIAIGLLGLVAILSFVVAPLLRERINRQFLLGAQNQAFLTEYIAGMSTVKSLQMEPDVERRFGGLLARYLAAGFATRQIGNSYNVVANALEQAMTLAILVVGALLVMKNDGFTIGMLVAFQMFASRMSQPMLRLVGLWQEFQQANIAVRRLGDIIDQPQEPQALTPSRSRGDGARGQLDLVGLAFRYGERHPWLYRNLSLRFRPGHLAVITGPSGAGKSTLAKLLLGFYPPADGQILLDGCDIRNLAANELRAAFGVVPQETVLFAGTLYDNLVMAHPHAGFDDVVAACKAAEIHEVIEQLPNGYQTEIGERGTGLSGGQRQRIAIARALLKRPRILIFDEAVANLDQQTAEQFAKTINKLKGKATMLFITHQIPRGLQVDEVFSLGGSHDVMKMGVVHEKQSVATNGPGNSNGEH